MTAPASPADVRAVECVACGELFEAGDDIDRTHDDYVAHLPACPHTRSPFVQWIAPLFAPGPYSRCAVKR